MGLSSRAGHSELRLKEGGGVANVMERWLTCVRPLRMQDMLDQHTHTGDQTVSEMRVPPLEVLPTPDARPRGGQSPHPFLAVAEEICHMRMFAADVSLNITRL